MRPTGIEDVSRETVEALQSFHALLLKWTPRINLISRRDIDDVWARHIEDSLQLSGLATSPGPHWLDIGSGGGLPGIVLAILHRETRPDARHTLIESDGRKAAFLATAIHEFKLTATLFAERVEDVPPQSADVVTARALAPLDRLLPLVQRHISSNGQALLPKGRNIADELAAVSTDWHFDHDLIPSVTSTDASILHLKRLTRD